MLGIQYVNHRAQNWNGVGVVNVFDKIAVNRFYGFNLAAICHNSVTACLLAPMPCALRLFH
jgi:hypothetical protein